MTGDKKPDNITLADYYKNAVKSVVGNGSSIEVNLLGFDEKGDEAEQVHKALVYDFVPHRHSWQIYPYLDYDHL